MKWGMLFSIFYLITNVALAIPDAAFYNGIYEPPSNGTNNIEALNSHSIRVFQWNVFRYQEMQNSSWQCAKAFNQGSKDFCHSIQSSELILLQESKSAYQAPRNWGDWYLGLAAKHSAFAPYGVNKDPSNRDLLFMSFDEKANKGLVLQAPIHYGSTTYSATAPLTSVVRMTENPDQVYEFYMPLIATTYPLAGRSETLLVVNFHNSAVVDANVQWDLLSKAEALIAVHYGPVLLAGDFNTWTAAKMNNVYLMTGRQGLKAIGFHTPYETPVGLRQLDHAFVRGMGLKSGSLKTYSTSVRLSDHTAISYELSVL